MISRDYRFRGPTALRRVYQSGKTVRGPHFGLKYLENPRRRNFRVAIVVSRKVEKSAVARNRLRRRLYAAIRGLDPKIDKPYDIILTVFDGTLVKQSPANLSKELVRQLVLAGVLDKPGS